MFLEMKVDAGHGFGAAHDRTFSICIACLGTFGGALADAVCVAARRACLRAWADAIVIAVVWASSGTDDRAFEGAVAVIGAFRWALGRAFALVITIVRTF